uniref:Uncharacterized protein n=1 Tax=Siphoviridae sp. ctB3v5 TaxID=2826186 RepID=A0A8S5M8U3_9CAUD|nr:MAG TPA: hypothetical protein [Siphoviridae sp. ctB3v5]
MRAFVLENLFIFLSFGMGFFVFVRLIRFYSTTT